MELQLTSQSELVADEFVETILAFDKLNSFSALNSCRTIFYFLFGLWLVFFVSIAISYFMHGDYKTHHLLEIENKTPSKEEVIDKLQVFVDSCFPSVFLPSFNSRAVIGILGQIKRRHRYLQLFTMTGADAPRKRMLIMVQLLVEQHILMFLLALLFNLQVNGICVNSCVVVFNFKLSVSLR